MINCWKVEIQVELVSETVRFGARRVILCLKLPLIVFEL
jgi:hypothetical protein